MAEPDTDPHGARSIKRQSARHERALADASPQLFAAHNVAVADDGPMPRWLSNMLQERMAA